MKIRGRRVKAGLVVLGGAAVVFACVAFGHRHHARREHMLWQRHNEAGLAALDDGSHARAEEEFRAALTVAEKLGEQDPRLADTLNNLAGLYCDQGRYADAESLLERALAIWEGARGGDHLEVATILTNLAAVYLDQGRYGKCEAPLRRVLEIRKGALGSEHLDVAQSLADLANLYHTQGRYAEAETRYKEALAIREKVLGRDHLCVATTLEVYAALLGRAGRDSEAAAFEARAKAIRDKHVQEGPTK